MLFKNNLISCRGWFRKILDRPCLGRFYFNSKFGGNIGKTRKNRPGKRNKNIPERE